MKLFWSNYLGCSSTRFQLNSKLKKYYNNYYFLLLAIAAHRFKSKTGQRKKEVLSSTDSGLCYKSDATNCLLLKVALVVSLLTRGLLNVLGGIYKLYFMFLLLLYFFQLLLDKIDATSSRIESLKKNS